MKLQMAVLASAYSLALAAPLMAQTAQPAQPPSATSQPAEPDAGRLALARQLVELSGGEKQVAAQMKMEMEVVAGAVERNLPPEAGRLAKPIYDDMSAQMVKLTPQFVDTSTRLYAEAFTDKELRDWIAFETSDSGRAVIEKMPGVRKKLLEAVVPMAMQMVPDLMRKASERVCEEQHCTAKERQIVADAMAKALPGKGS